MSNFSINNVLAYAQTFRGYFPEMSQGGLVAEVQSIIRQLAAEMHAPTNYVLGEVLTAFGCAVGRKVIVRDGSYWNYLNLYSCLVGYAGSGKTPSAQHVLQPIGAFNAREKSKYARELRRAKAENASQTPQYNAILVKNITSEKLFKVLDRKQNDKYNTGVLLHCGELYSHFGNLDRYNTGNSRPYYLDLYSGQDISIERMYDDEGILIRKPFLSILGDIQPKELRKVFPASDSSGFFSRWCFFLSNGKCERCTENTIYMEHWRTMVERAIEMGPVDLRFSKDVLPLLASNDEERESMCDYLAESNSELAEYIIKQNYTVRRLAGIVHCLNALVRGEVPEPEIPQLEYEYAKELVEYLIKSAAVVQQMRACSHIDKLTGKALIQKLNDRYPIKNISLFAEVLGLSKQYVSSCLLRKDTTKIEKDELVINDTYMEWVNYLVANHQSLIDSVGRIPTFEEVEGWLSYPENQVKSTLRAMEGYRPIEYSILFDQLVRVSSSTR